MKKYEEQFNSVIASSETARKTAEGTLNRLLNSTSQYAELAYCITDGYVSAEDKFDAAEGTRRESLARLEELKAIFPYLRGVGILMGRLYLHLKDLDSAINILEEILRERGNRGITPDKDDDALHFNCACYKNLVANQEMDRGERGKEERL